MPTIPSSVISQFLGHPDPTLLYPSLDQNGPFAAGPHTFTNYTTLGAGLTPAGTYDLSGVYGMFLEVNGAIPATWGFVTNWSDPSGLYDESVYENRFCQVVVQNKLLSGAWLTTEVYDVHTVLFGFLFAVGVLPIAGQRRVGLQIGPGIHMDAFYFSLA